MKTIILLTLTSLLMASDPSPYETALKKQNTAFTKLAFLKGAWESSAYFMDTESNDWKEMKAEDNIDPTVKIAESKRAKALVIEIPGKTAYYGRFTYDVFQDVYRVAFIDDALGLLDVFEGTFDGDRLVLSNLKSGTFFLQDNIKTFSRLIFEPHGAGWLLLADMTVDEGESWNPAFKLVASRNKGIAAN